MTLTTPGPAPAVPPGTPGPHTPPDAVRCTIDGFDVAVPKGTLIIRAAEMIGVQIPRFCDQPLLEPVGACRQCLVEVEGQRKPVASCTRGVCVWTTMPSLTGVEQPVWSFGMPSISTRHMRQAPTGSPSFGS